METTKKATVKKTPAKKAATEKKLPVLQAAARKVIEIAAPLVVDAPGHEQISKSAYLIWANRGFSQGDPNHDWIQAERELKRA